MTTRATFAFALAGLLLGLPPVEGQAARASDQHAQDFYPPWAATARFNTPLSVRDTDGALGRLSLQPKELTLEDVARVHGHLCDGENHLYPKIVLPISKYFSAKLLWANSQSIGPEIAELIERENQRWGDEYQI